MAIGAGRSAWPGGGWSRSAIRGARSPGSSRATAGSSSRGMRVSVFGLGYVGCVTAACLARAGHRVIGIDINPDKVAMVNSGTSPLVEPGLGELLAEVTAAGRLRSSTAVEEAVAESELALICVGTPSRDNGQLDVEAVR